MGSHEEDSLEPVVQLSVFAFGLSVQLASVHHGYVRYSLDGLVLLLHQGFGWRKEKNLLSGKPKIVVADDVDGDEGFPETSGKTDEGVVGQGDFGDLVLIPSELLVENIVVISILHFQEILHGFPLQFPNADFLVLKLFSDLGFLLGSALLYSVPNKVIVALL